MTTRRGLDSPLWQRGSPQKRGLEVLLFVALTQAPQTPYCEMEEAETRQKEDVPVGVYAIPGVNDVLLPHG